VEEYLLNARHSQNSGKAQFFERAGYDPAQPERLINDLKTIAKTGRVTAVQPTPRGVKYVVTATITAPNRRKYSLRTVWIIDENQTIPRFLTAYPNKK
jgi:predicted thioesterase